MRPIFLLAIIIFVEVYAFQAVRTFTTGWNEWTKQWVHIAYWSFPVLAAVLYLWAQQGPLHQPWKGVFLILRAIVVIAYLSKLLTVLFVFIDDVRRLTWKGAHWAGLVPEFDAGRSRFLNQLALLLGLTPFATLTYGITRRHDYQVRRVCIPIKGLHKGLEGLRIVQISDIHSGSFTDNHAVAAAIRLINAQVPDIVLFTGDLVNATADEALPFVPIFRKIRARYGVFSILGNHDYGDYHHWPNAEAKAANMRLLEHIHKRQLGWNLLRNEHQSVFINGAQLDIIGVDNYSALRRFQKYGDLAKAWQGTSGDLKILLSHDPTHWELQVLDYPDIAITFSGHTHGMQFGIDIPGWIKWSPAQYVYKQWAGLYQKDHQFLYVNRGLGYLAYPGRVGILPEITLVELTGDTTTPPTEEVLMTHYQR